MTTQLARCPWADQQHLEASKLHCCCPKLRQHSPTVICYPPWLPCEVVALARSGLEATHFQVIYHWCSSTVCEQGRGSMLFSGICFGDIYFRWCVLHAVGTQFFCPIYLRKQPHAPCSSIHHFSQLILSRHKKNLWQMILTVEIHPNLEVRWEHSILLFLLIISSFLNLDRMSACWSSSPKPKRLAHLARQFPLATCTGYRSGLMSSSNNSKLALSTALCEFTTVNAGLETVATSLAAHEAMLYFALVTCAGFFVHFAFLLEQTDRLPASNNFQITTDSSSVIISQTGCAKTRKKIL